MKTFAYLVIWIAMAQFCEMSLICAPPILIQPNDSFGGQRIVGTGIQNLRVVSQSADRTEAELIMDYTYDGFGGGGITAQLLPAISKKGAKGTSTWFGSDPLTVGKGRGTVTMKVRYFNDEPGVPPSFVSDQVRILILNSSGSAILTSVPFLITIKWGNPETTAAAGEVAKQKAKQPPPAKSEDKGKEVAKANTAPRPAAPETSPQAKSYELTPGMKTKVTSVDVVSRSTDRTQMTFGVEFEYRDNLTGPLMGLDVLRQAEPEVSRYFVSKQAEVGKSRRNFVLFPVKFQPPAGSVGGPGFSTDKILVYLTDKSGAQRYNILPATMLLIWQDPAASQTKGKSAETAK